MHDFSLLLRLRLRTASNTFRFAGRAHRVVGGLLSLFSVGLFVAVLLAFGALLTAARQTAGAAVEQALIERTFLFLFLFLVSGGIPFVSGALFTPGDLPLLAGAPIRPTAVVAARLVDAIIVSSAQFVVIGVPLLVAAAWVLGLPPWAWLFFAVLLALFLALPALLVAALLLGAARLVGLRRIRAAVAFASAVLAVGMCLLTVAEFSRHSSRGGRTGGDPIAALRDAEMPPPPEWLPSTWASDALITLGMAQPEPERAAVPLLYLLGLTIAVAALCIRLGGPVLVGETLLEGESGIGAGSRLRGLPESLLSVLPFLSPPVRALIAKDWRYVARDLVLLSQIGIPVILYLVPFVIAEQIRAGSGASAQGDLLFLSIGIVATIVYMETSILSLSSVGLEGRAFWLVRSAPVTTAALLRAKWAAAFLLSVALSAPLLLCSFAVFSSAAREWLVPALLILVASCAALCGLGVGISALFPRFVYENPAHRASLAALIWGFVGATAYVVLSGIVVAGGVLAAGHWPEQARSFVGGAAAVFVLLSLATGLVPLLWGTQRLSGYAWEEG